MSDPQDGRNEGEAAEIPRCVTCRHWDQGRMQREWRGAIRLEWDEHESDQAHHEREKAAEEPFGICGAIDLLDTYDVVSQPPLAFTRDGSDYMATLYTHRDFGCILHTSAVAPPAVAGVGGEGKEQQ